MNTAQESTSSIIDNLSSLTNQNCDTSNKDLKTGTVIDIVNKKINTIEDYVNTRVINIYQRPWNKLETKLKLKKISEYYTIGPFLNKSEEDELQTTKRKKKGVEALNTVTQTELVQILNSSDKKRVKVDYNEAECRIVSILVSS